MGLHLGWWPDIDHSPLRCTFDPIELELVDDDAPDDQDGQNQDGGGGGEIASETRAGSSNVPADPHRSVAGPNTSVDKLVGNTHSVFLFARFCPTAFICAS